MAEKKILVFDKTFSYQGLFSVKEFYNEAKSWLEEHGYGAYEVMHEEQVFEEGKQIFVEINADKKLSDYAKVVWITKLTFSNIKEVNVEIEGSKVKTNKGSVKCVTMVISNTDWDKTLEQNPFQYFLRVVLDKYVFKNYISRAEKKAKKDYALFEKHLKSYLNMSKF